MPRVVVVHRDLAEAVFLAGRATRDGLEAAPYAHLGTRGFRGLRENPPDAVIIDLTRMPSYGRAMAVLLRESKGTRMIPLVFVEGDPEKMPPIREAFPDAVFTSWVRIGPAVRKALLHPPENPVIPKLFSSPLLKKLRIGEGSVVALRHAPDGFESVLGALPEGARLQSQVRDATIILIFVKTRAALGRELPELAKMTRKGLTIWLAWPKKSGSGGGDLTMPRVHDMCVAYGLTGYKMCSVDQTWSALAIAQGGSARNPG